MPLKASTEPPGMLISDGEGKKATLKNILVGEVWMTDTLATIIPCS